MIKVEDLRNYLKQLLIRFKNNEITDNEFIEDIISVVKVFQLKENEYE